MAAVMIGVDPHKASHTAVAIGAAGRPGPCRGRRAAIERSDGPVVDALFGAGITVVVISPNQVKNLRGRYGSPGTRTTASTRSCSLTLCAPTVPGCAR